MADEYKYDVEKAEKEFKDIVEQRPAEEDVLLPVEECCAQFLEAFSKENSQKCNEMLLNIIDIIQKDKDIKYEVLFESDVMKYIYYILENFDYNNEQQKLMIENCVYLVQEIIDSKNQDFIYKLIEEPIHRNIYRVLSTSYIYDTNLFKDALVTLSKMIKVNGAIGIDLMAEIDVELLAVILFEIESDDKAEIVELISQFFYYLLSNSYIIKPAETQTKFLQKSKEEEEEEEVVDEDDIDKDDSWLEKFKEGPPQIGPGIKIQYDSDVALDQYFDVIQQMLNIDALPYKINGVRLLTALVHRPVDSWRNQLSERTILKTQIITLITSNPLFLRELAFDLVIQIYGRKEVLEGLPPKSIIANLRTPTENPKREVKVLGIMKNSVAAKAGRLLELILRSHYKSVASFVDAGFLEEVVSFWPEAPLSARLTLARAINTFVAVCRNRAHLERMMGLGFKAVIFEALELPDSDIQCKALQSLETIMYGLNVGGDRLNAFVDSFSAEDQAAVEELMDSEVEVVAVAAEMFIEKVKRIVDKNEEEDDDEPLFKF